MSLGPGTRLGTYEIVAPLGAGGMGEVFRARDGKLQRDVAIKALPAPFADDPERVARFEREAQALAALHHPNIAGIFDLLEHGGARYLVLELVDGETLAARLARGPLPIDEATGLARQIADALEAAHDRGIVHRDLKPGNVMVTADGTVKVLDFGLAKPVDAASGATTAGSPGYSQSPTLMSLTSGMILGTAAYMSPEQARGRPVDRRADIWAFGCVLFEMLTAAPAFGGDTVSDTISAILRGEPDWSRLPADTPAAIRTLLRRCLAKELKQRLPHIGVARIELAEPMTATPTTEVNAATPFRAPRLRLAWSTAAIFAVSSLGLGWWIATRPAMPLRIVQVASGDGVRWPAISPDGRAVAFTRDQRLMVRYLDEPTERELAPAGNVPFWSADSSSIGYFAPASQSSEVRVVAAAGGPSRLVSRSSFPSFGGAFCQDGVLFARSGMGLRIVREGTGEQAFVEVDGEGGEINIGYPHCLGDGRVMAISQAPGRSRIVVFEKGGGRRTLFEFTDVPTAAGIGVRWPILAGDHILVERTEPNRGLWALPVTRDLDVSGVLKPVLSDWSTPTVAAGDVLAVLDGQRAVDRELVFVDRAGRRVSTFGRPQVDHMSPTLSPLADFVASAGIIGGDSALWIHGEATVRRLADRVSANSGDAAWSPDGTRLAFVRAEANGEGELVIASVTRPDPLTVMVRNVALRHPVWTPDGSTVIYSSANRTSREDASGTDGIFGIDIAPGATPRLLIPSAAEAAPSPDGRSLAYTALAAGRRDVFITTWPPSDRVWAVSTERSRSPRWSRDGRELFFPCGPQIGNDNNSHQFLCVARIDTRNGVTVGKPVRLFDVMAAGVRTSVRGYRGYDVGPDPNRILVQTAGIEGAAVITLVQPFSQWLARPTR